MQVHHMVEAAGIVALCLVVYSFMCRRFAPPARLPARWRPLLVGLVFGAGAVALMISRIRVAPGVHVDARAVPLALVALVEGWPAGLVSALPAIAWRLWQGGTAAPAGVLGILATTAAGVLVHYWARRDRGVRARHALGLTLAVYAVTLGPFLLLGSGGLTLLTHRALPLFVVTLVGIGTGARLFWDVAAGLAAEAARREAGELRAVTLLARAAAHEINNPLTAVLGGLALIARRLPAGSEDAEWVRRATEAAERIRDIVARMNRITAVEEVPPQGSLPPMLDIRKSSTPPGEGGA